MGCHQNLVLHNFIEKSEAQRAIVIMPAVPIPVPPLLLTLWETVVSHPETWATGPTSRPSILM